MIHLLALNEQEIETVYFALNDYALKYMKLSKTWARTSFQKDYAHEQAEEVGRLQVKVGDEMMNTKPNEI